MSAKLLNVFGDENPELKKQIGCMTGIFQMFDRQHLLTPRKLAGHNRRNLPSGNSTSIGRQVHAETRACSPRIILEKNLDRSVRDNHRVSVESSRASFSSSTCSSSFSSVECNRSIQQDPCLYEKPAFPEKSFKNSETSQGSDVDRPSRHLSCSETQDVSTPRQSLNFRDVVKDSIYRDRNGLTIKTSSKGEMKQHVVKHLDSPKPSPSSKLMDGSYLIRTNEKPRTPVDLKESLGILARLKEAPRYFSEGREPARSSFDAKSDPFFSAPKEAPRFSYDGRDDFHPSLDPRDNNKYPTQLSELPRFSLDSRQGSMTSSSFDPKSKSVLENTQDAKATQRAHGSLSLQRDLASKRPVGVVAKLMGLDPMPLNSSKDQLQLKERCSMKDTNALGGTEKSSFLSKRLTMPEASKQEYLTYSPRSSLKGSVIPRPRTAEPVMKPISISRLPIEPAPWRQHNKGHGVHKTTLSSDSHMKQHQESIFSEIERKLKGLEFHQSNKDLRALKHILDSLHAKGLLETKKDEGQPCEASGDNFSNPTVAGFNHNMRTMGHKKSYNHPHSSLVKGANATRPFESPIVIMRPAKSVNQAGINVCSLVHFEGLSTVHKVHSGDTDDLIDTKKPSVHNRLPKQKNSKLKSNENASQTPVYVDRRSSRQNTHVSHKASEMYHSSSRPLRCTMENNNCSVKTSASLSPRLQQNRIDLDRKSHPHVSSSESSKQQKLCTRHISESVSPRSRTISKSGKGQKGNKQLSEINSDTGNPGQHHDEHSHRAESNISVSSKLDTEVTSADRSAEVKCTMIQQRSQISPDQTAKNVTSVLEEKKSLLSLAEGTSAELAAISMEQPSPVSVLDTSLCRDDQPVSPVRKFSNFLRGDDAQRTGISKGGSWKTAEPDSQLPSNPNYACSTMSHKKLESIENLLLKLRRLSSLDEEAAATDHIASLCDTQNPELRYVSEILLASGILLKDLGSVHRERVPVQIHKSGYPINPNLFFVLEQTKGSSCNSKSDSEKLRRRLLFDAVNEILVRKLDLSGLPPFGSRLSYGSATGKQLLKELCREIQRLQAFSRRGAGQDEGADGLKMILREDVGRHSGRWTDAGPELPGLVLDIERSIFKDLIDEVLSGESAASGLTVRTSRRHRPLFK